jgi:hypothetical protein
MSVNEYVTKFTQLSRYVSHEVNTDKKKYECFLNGLNDGRQHQLGSNSRPRVSTSSVGPVFHPAQPQF